MDITKSEGRRDGTLYKLLLELLLLLVGDPGSIIPDDDPRSIVWNADPGSILDLDPGSPVVYGDFTFLLGVV